jgi:hypothetical protein
MPACVGPPASLTAEIRERGEHIPGTAELDNPDPRDIQRVADAQLATMSDAEIQSHNNITDDPSMLLDELAALAEAGVTRVLVGSPLRGPPGDDRRVRRRDPPRCGGVVRAVVWPG